MTKDCPREGSRPEKSLPNGAAGSMAGAKKVHHSAPVKTTTKGG